TETEATGAPQKHHYTLNQQVGSITLLASNADVGHAIVGEADLIITGFLMVLRTYSWYGPDKRPAVVFYRHWAPAPC
ncbi:hypothetical protein ACJWSO_23385, partial [Klebsiella pneumoniae]